MNHHGSEKGKSCRQVEEETVAFQWLITTDNHGYKVDKLSKEPNDRKGGEFVDDKLFDDKFPSLFKDVFWSQPCLLPDYAFKYLFLTTRNQTSKVAECKSSQDKVAVFLILNHIDLYKSGPFSVSRIIDNLKRVSYYVLQGNRHTDDKIPNRESS